MTAPDRPLLDRLAGHARARPDAPALRVIGDDGRERRRLTCAELERQSSGIAQRLRQELPARSVVVLCLANSCEFATMFLGVWKAGMTVFPVSPTLRPPELLDAIGRSGAAIVIGAGCTPRTRSGLPCPVRRPDELIGGPVGGGLPAPPAPPPGDGAMYLQSSGTTDRPKIVRRLGLSLDAVARGVCTALSCTMRDRVLAAIPMCHSYGVEHALLGPLYAGAEIVALTRFEPAVAERLLDDATITLFPATPFMLHALAEHRDEPLRHSLRAVYSAGGVLPPGVYEAFARRAAMPVGQLYGSTEVGSATYHDPALPGFDPASVGQPLAGVEVRILDPDRPDPERPRKPGVEGHVAVRADSMLDGYVDDAAPAHVGGWFLTGDLGRVDERGCLYLTGRIKLQIDVGGRKVNPHEVEQVIMDYPGIAACIVVPMPVTATLNRLRAVIVPRTPGARPDIEALRRHVRDRLEGFKVPRIIECRTMLPRTPSGKVDRSAIAGVPT